MELLKPSKERVELFNSFWEFSSTYVRLKLFEDDEERDVTKYIAPFKAYGDKDKEISQKTDLKEFLFSIDDAYHTRVPKLMNVVNGLNHIGIMDKTG